MTGERVNKIPTFSVLALAVLGMQQTHGLPLETKTADTDAIVKAIMADQYGDHYDQVHACWSFSHASEQGDAVDYCMRPGKPVLVDTANGQQLYLYAANANDIQGDHRYLYSQNQPGLMGAFKVKLDGKGGWTYLAMDNAMAFGSGGNCGCNGAEPVKLTTRGDLGWLFTSGGVWQGTVVSDYDIVVAHRGRFVDVSSIPQIAESAQGVRYRLSIADDHPVDGWFPLHITRTQAGGQSMSFLVNFDVTKFAYALPSGR